MKSTENVSLYGKNSIAFRLKYDNGLLTNMDQPKNESPTPVNKTQVSMQKVKSQSLTVTRQMQKQRQSQ